MAQALVQRVDPTAEDYDTAFWLNTVIACGLAAVFAALGPVLAAFYGQPRLTALAAVMAVGLALSLGTVHLARLISASAFRRIAGVELVAPLTVGVSAILLALRGAGVWSLVVDRWPVPL